MNTISINVAKTDYHGGETIDGTVHLVLAEPIPARGVRLRAHGLETSLWHTGNGRNLATHAAEIPLFDEELTLFGEPSLGMTGILKDCVSGLFSRERYPTIEPGRYEYPFTIALPSQLPGDYESPHGDVAIRYELRAYVDIPLKVDIEAVQRLTIYEPFDAAIDSAALIGNKSFPFSSSDQLAVKAHLDKNVYKLGDAMTIELEIDNRSCHPVEGVSVGLRHTEVLTARGATTERARQSCIQEIACEVAERKRATRTITYVIDPALYPSLSTGEMIRLDYHVVISFDIPWAIDLHLEIPIRLIEEPGKPGGAI